MLLRSIVESPFVYDLTQELAGARVVSARLRPHLRSFAGTRVLDVGAGTGRYVRAVPDPANYVAVDLDPVKLARLQAKWPDVETVVGDASRLPFAPDSFDNALCTFLVHHLADAELERFTAGLRRVVRQTLVLVDPLHAPDRLRSRALWSIDRGSHPRSAADLLTALERDFIVRRQERFQVHHRYLLLVATPRPNG